jgi:hypothetical protein
MSLLYQDYLKICNNYCIKYWGIEEKIVLDLIKFKKIINQKFPSVNLFISCTDELSKKYKDEFLIGNSSFKRENFAYVREIKNDFLKNPIITLAQECEIDF